jgi:phosphoglycolate phosphatase-like HAD superfamily hydrolase
MDQAKIIFDVDGTLVDSVAGIEYSVDRACEKRGYTLRISDLRTLISPLRSPMAVDRVSAATSVVAGDTLEDWEAASEVGMPAATLAPGYGRLWHVAPRSPHLFGTLDELGSIFARVGGIA